MPKLRGDDEPEKKTPIHSQGTQTSDDHNRHGLISLVKNDRVLKPA